jgi:signal transduction histidine kinase
MVEYVQADREERFFIGGFYGILLIMILYNVSLFVAIRERVYVMYVLYALTYGFYQWIVDGLYFEVFSAVVPYRTWFMQTTGFVFLAFAVLFARDFLRTRTYLPRFDRVLLVSLVTALLLAAASPLAGRNLYVVTRIGWLFMVAFSVTSLVAAVVVYRAGYKPAGIYVVAASGMIAGFVVRMLRVAEVIPYQQFLEDSVKLGFLWELSFLSVALANRIREYRAERERERHRIRSQISRDLHDEVGSDLSSIALGMEMIAASAGRRSRHWEDLTSLSRLARQATDSLRDVVWLINPARESVSDFAAKITETAHRILGSVLLTVDVNPAQLGSMDLELRRNLFLMTKEALTNIARHAKASAVTISLRRENNDLVLTVHDDGRGFDPSRRMQGSGLSGIRLRAEAFGGRLSIDTSRGRGSTLRVVIPPAKKGNYEIP